MTRLRRKAVGAGDFEHIANKRFANCGAELTWLEDGNVKEGTLRVRRHHLFTTLLVCRHQVREVMNRSRLNILLYPAVCPSEQAIASPSGWDLTIPTTSLISMLAAWASWSRTSDTRSKYSSTWPPPFFGAMILAPNTVKDSSFCASHSSEDSSRPWF